MNSQSYVPAKARLKRTSFYLCALVLLMGCGCDTNDSVRLLEVEDFAKAKSINTGMFQLDSATLENRRVMLFISDTISAVNPIIEEQRMSYLAQAVFRLNSVSYDSVVVQISLPFRLSEPMRRLAIDSIGFEHAFASFNDPCFSAIVDTLMVIDRESGAQGFLNNLNLDLAQMIFGDKQVNSAFFGYNTFALIAGYQEETKENRQGDYHRLLNAIVDETNNRIVKAKTPSTVAVITAPAPSGFQKKVEFDYLAGVKRFTTALMQCSQKITE